MPRYSRRARGRLAARYAASEAQMTSKKTEGTEPVVDETSREAAASQERGQEVCSCGHRASSHVALKYSCQAPGEDKGYCPCCASFQGSYCKGLAHGSGEDARSRRSRIAGQLPAAIEGLAARRGFQKRNKTEKCPARLAGARSRKAPRPGGDRLAQPIRRMNVAGVPVTVG